MNSRRVVRDPVASFSWSRPPTWVTLALGLSTIAAIFTIFGMSLARGHAPATPAPSADPVPPSPATPTVAAAVATEAPAPTPAAAEPVVSFSRGGSGVAESAREAASVESSPPEASSPTRMSTGGLVVTDYSSGRWETHVEDGLDEILKPVRDRLLHSVFTTVESPFWFTVPAKDEDEPRYNILKLGQFHEKSLTATLYHFFRDTYRVHENPDALMLLDVGCNAGWATFTSAALGARAVCVEPHPRLKPRLRTSRLLNSRFAHRISFVFAGASSAPGSMILHTPIHFGASTVIQGPCSASETAKGRCNRVDIVRLDDVLRAPGSPFLAESGGDPSASYPAQALTPLTPSALRGGASAASSTTPVAWDAWPRQPPIFLKIDVEGLEYDVLKGLSGALDSGRIHFVYFESNEAKYKKRGFSVVKLLQLLHDKRYSIAYTDNPKVHPHFFVGNKPLPASRFADLAQAVATIQANFLFIHETARARGAHFTFEQLKRLVDSFGP